MSTGRPRDPRIDEDVRRAVLEMLVEGGYEAVTVQGVARRARVGAPTIYRRWPAKVDMVEHAVFPMTWSPPPPTGDRREDLRRLAANVLDGLVRPAMRAAIPGLLVAYQADPARHRRLIRRAQPALEKAFAAVLPDVADHARADLFDVFNNTLITHALLHGSSGRRRIERVVADVVAGACRSFVT